MKENINVLDQSLRYFETGNVAFFFGAGISKIAGCKTSNSLLKDMSENPVIQTTIDRNEFFNNQVVSSEEKLDLCKRELDRVDRIEEYKAMIRNAVFEDPELFNKKYIPFLKTLKSIKPFPIIITTNIDNCLEKTRLFPLDRIFYRKNQFKKENFKPDSIFHIHGYIEDLDNAVFTKSQYREWYEDGEFKNFLTHIFINYCVIFMGYSFNDNELKNIIFDARNRNNSLPNFILFPLEDRITQIQKSNIEILYKIEVIVYGNLKDFTEIIRSWIDRNFPQIPKIEDINNEN
ncbi:MAG: SIR2 family protein [Promethearchaeota archaeon]